MTHCEERHFQEPLSAAAQTNTSFKLSKCFTLNILELSNAKTNKGHYGFQL